MRKINELQNLPTSIYNELQEASYIGQHRDSCRAASITREPAVLNSKKAEGE